MLNVSSVDPAENPANWQETVDSKTGRTYFYSELFCFVHRLTKYHWSLEPIIVADKAAKATSWVKPACLRSEADQAKEKEKESADAAPAAKRVSRHLS